MSEPEVRSTPLGGAAMVRGGRVAPAAGAWFAPRPAAPDEWRQHLDRVRQSVPAMWLAALEPAIAPGDAAAARLQRVKDGAGVVVTTGQQPGLFGGPLYTWWKALSALALADELERITGVPVAPVFWAATDDADFDEARTTWVARRGGLLAIAMPGEGDGNSLAATPLPDVRAQLAALASGAGSAVHPAVLDLARDAYRDGATVGGAYVALLRALLEPLGIAVLDAAHAAVRRAGAPVVRAALQAAPAIEAALIARDAEIRSAGFRPQVPVVRGRSLVFAVGEEGRDRVPIAGAARATALPDESLGPNVLLRPVMERAILPTAAYVAGPAELAYFAQVSAVAGALGAAQPVSVPRWSGLVIEPHIARLLERHDLTLDSLVDPHAAEGQLARRSLDERVRGALDEVSGRVGPALEALSAALREAGPTVPDAVLEGVRRDVERRLTRLERRIVAAAKREASSLMEDLATLRAALRPNDGPQERSLNLLPLLARHGPAVLQGALAQARRHAEALVDGRAGVPDESPALAPSAGDDRTR